MKRFIICNAWEHIFLEDGRERKRIVRFVYDRTKESLPVLDIQRDNKWRASTPDERADVLDSLRNANPNALLNPGNWDMTEAGSLPDWN